MKEFDLLRMIRSARKADLLFELYFSKQARELVSYCEDFMLPSKEYFSQIRKDNSSAGLLSSGIWKLPHTEAPELIKKAVFMGKREKAFLKMISKDINLIEPLSNGESKKEISKPSIGF